MKIKAKNFKIPEFFNLLFVLTIALVLVTLVSYSLNYLEKTLTKKSEARGNPISVSKVISTGYVGNYGARGFSETVTMTPIVLAASTYQPPLWEARLTDQNYTNINIEPGKSITIEAYFKNVGSATWKNSGADEVTLVSRYPDSNFQSDFWYSDRVAGKLEQTEVKPGEQGFFKFAVKAPEQEEWYREEFVLAKDGHSILGSVLTISMKAGQPLPYFQAEEVARSYNSITLTPDRAITFWVDFKNTGRATWVNSGDHFVALNVSDPAGRISPFQHEYWNEYYYRPTRLDNREVKPGEIGRFTFALETPETPGSYVENFHLVAENLTWFSEGHLAIPIKVENPTPEVVVTAGEDNIRVGLYSTDEEIEITADGRYEIRDSDGRLIATKNKNVVSKVTYNNGQYVLVAPSTNLTTGKYLKFIPKSTETIMELANYENHPAWNSSLNDNLFRGTIEIRYAEATNKLWVINELPLESYLRGLAEAGNDNPEEYLKALLTAARSYAKYHINTYSKHAEEYFHVDSTYDQVYRGLNFELRASAITEAQEATRGMMVTYEDEVVVTPYFSRADGRTRSWEEVWSGGPYPWLVSVLDPWSEGDTLWGHGVGMPAESARAQAEEGKTYRQILKYYYTGVKIEKIY